MNALLLHGWGTENTVWEEAQNSFSVFDSFLSPCLYDIVKKHKNSDLDSIASDLSGSIGPDTVVLAWSLGGLIATSLQNLSDKVKAIVFIASSPCFVNKEGWQNVIDISNIKDLQVRLECNTTKALQYFSGLVVHGDVKPKETNKILRQHLTNEENKGILIAWLHQMKSIDFRKNFAEINCPVLVISGENDSLFKAGIENDLKQLNQNIESRVIKDCGHAPFLGKQSETSMIINEFINAKFG